MVYSEIENLARALPVGEKMRLAQVLMSDAAWSQTQPLESSQYPKYVEVCLPWHKLDTIQVTELEIDDATLELERAESMKRAEEMAKRWAGMTIELGMRLLPTDQSTRAAERD